MTRTQITNNISAKTELRLFAFLIKIGTPKIRQESSGWEKFVLIQRKTYLYCQYTRKIRTVTTAFTHMNANTPFIPFISWVLLFICALPYRIFTHSLFPSRHYHHHQKTTTFTWLLFFSPFTFQDEALILLSWCMVVVNTLTYK